MITGAEKSVACISIDCSFVAFDFMSGTDKAGSPSHEQEDAHRLSPELVVAVTSVTLPIPSQCRLVSFC